MSNSSVIFINYPKCNTCRKALKWLKENNIRFCNRDITIDNPSKSELSAWIMQSRLPVARFFNTSGRIYKELQLKEKLKTASEAELLDMLSSDGMVVKRPLLVSDQFVLVGFNEAQWAEKLKESTFFDNN